MRFEIHTTSGQPVELELPADRSARLFVDEIEDRLVLEVDTWLATLQSVIENTGLPVRWLPKGGHDMAVLEFVDAEEDEADGETPSDREPGRGDF